MNALARNVRALTNDIYHSERGLTSYLLKRAELRNHNRDLVAYREAYVHSL